MKFPRRCLVRTGFEPIQSDDSAASTAPEPLRMKLARVSHQSPVGEPRHHSFSTARIRGLSSRPKRGGSSFSILRVRYDADHPVEVFRKSTAGGKDRWAPPPAPGGGRVIRSFVAWPPGCRASRLGVVVGLVRSGPRHECRMPPETRWDERFV